MPALYNENDPKAAAWLRELIAGGHTMPRSDYELRQMMRRDRLERASERAQAKADAAYRRADLREEVSGIPLGQPILVGHHSERRHRRALERADNAMRTAIDEDRKAGEYAARAASVGQEGSISSDDPEAIVKLREKLAGMEARQAQMKAANAQWRKAGNKGGRQPDGSWLEPPYPPYSLTNNSANMKRVRDRIAHLERDFQRESKTTQVGDAELVENVESNRVQIVFPGKPDHETRRLLKSRGFRWSPSEGAWQRLLNNAGIWAAQQVLAEMERGKP